MRANRRLIQTSFSVESVFYDGLWRLHYEFSSAASYDQYKQYVLCDHTLVEAKADWKQVLIRTGSTDPQADAEFDFDSATLQSALKSLVDSSELLVFPRNVECLTRYTVSSVTAKYGTVEAVFEVVCTEARHLKIPVGLFTTSENSIIRRYNS